MATKVSRRLQNILLNSNLITKDELEKAIQSQNGKSLLRSLVELGFVSEKKIALAIAEQMHLEYVDLDKIDIDPNAVTSIDEELINRYKLIPIASTDSQLTVAMVDPTNIFALDDLHLVTGKSVIPVVATETDVETAISRFSRMDKSVEEMVEDATDEADVEVSSQEEQETEDAPIVKLVNLILMEAVRDRANDVHIEPQDSDVRVRYRIDGVLYEVMRSPKGTHSGIVARIKIMAGMDIAERRIPQDGRFAINIDNQTVDFRVATLPTIYGEKIVLRLLKKDSISIGLEKLGLSKTALERFKSSFSKPYGAILVTGPTGSGKTTTLYGAMMALNSPEKNLITVEDPVEYRVPGIAQVQVNQKADMTFAAALRSILRNDPDVVMIGEIRDEETALISVESALTGHLVLSTLHTNDAASALTRLTEMGVEPFLVSSAVDCVVTQRLARRLCKECREPYQPSKQLLADLQLSNSSEPLTFYKHRGCKKCGGIGYHGRIGLYEVLLVSEQIERLTVQRASSEVIAREAVKEGMVPLKFDGLEKVKQGITSVEEVLRVAV